MTTSAQDVLVRFLRKALAEKRERLCGFASKPKTRPKFFSTLYHSLGSFVSPSIVTPELPETAWSTPAYGFITPDRFGVPFDSLRVAYDELPTDEGALFVTTDCRFGVYCDHTYGDAHLLLAIKRGR